MNNIDELLSNGNTALKNANVVFERELKILQSSGKKYISDKEIDDILLKIIKTELVDNWKEHYY